MHKKINPFLIESVKHYPQASGLQHLAGDLVPVMKKHRQLVIDCDGENDSSESQQVSESCIMMNCH